jgi:RND family efflux transporter MFP subunit
MQELLQTGQGALASTQLKSEKAVVQSDAKIGEVDTAYKVAGYEVEYAHQFQKLDSEVFSRREIAESMVDGELAEFKQDNATHSRETQRALARTELEILAIQQGQAEQKIEEAENGLEDLEVRAPHDGIFNLKATWQGLPEVGSQMWSGLQVGEIPDLSVVQAEVFVLEADAGSLVVGKAARVVVEAYPGHPLAGEITRVDKVAKPRLRGSPVQYFGVTISFPETDRAIMKPGQRVRATLFLEEYEEVLAVPRQAVFEEDGQRHVFIREAGAYSARVIEVAASTMGRHIISEGLHEGDVVALSRPLGVRVNLPEAAEKESLEAADLASESDDA